MINLTPVIINVDSKIESILNIIKDEIIKLNNKDITYIGNEDDDALYDFVSKLQNGMTVAYIDLTRYHPLKISPDEEKYLNDTFDSIYVLISNINKRLPKGYKVSDDLDDYEGYIHLTRYED